MIRFVQVPEVAQEFHTPRTRKRTGAPGVCLVIAVMLSAAGCRPRAAAPPEPLEPLSMALVLDADSTPFPEHVKEVSYRGEMIRIDDSTRRLLSGLARVETPDVEGELRLGVHLAPADIPWCSDFTRRHVGETWALMAGDRVLISALLNEGITAGQMEISGISGEGTTGLASTLKRYVSRPEAAPARPPRR